jgi:hypothetical protein
LGLATLGAALAFVNSKTRRKRQPPRVVIFLCLCVLVLNFFAVGLRYDSYPMYSVSMFSWNGPNTLPQVYYTETYAFKSRGRLVPLELRFEGLFPSKKNLPWNFGNVSSFSTTFHNRGSAKNHKYLEGLTGKPLLVIVQRVDLSTGSIDLIDDQCAYATYRPILADYYGPLYVPDHQKKACET